MCALNVSSQAAKRKLDKENKQNVVNYRQLENITSVYCCTQS